MGWKKYKRYLKKLVKDPWKRPYQSMKGIYTGLRKGEGFSDVMTRAARPLRKGAGGSLIGAIAPLAGKVVGGYFAGPTGAKVGGAVGSELGSRFDEAAARDLTSEVDAQRQRLDSLRGMAMSRFQSPMAEAWQRTQGYLGGMRMPGGMGGMAQQALMQMPRRGMPYGGMMAGGGAGMLTSMISDPRTMQGISSAASGAGDWLGDLWSRAPEQPTFDPGGLEDWGEMSDEDFEEYWDED